MSDMIRNLPPRTYFTNVKKYGSFVVDPPWPYRSKGKFGQTLEHRPNRDNTLARLGTSSRDRYGAMTIKELMNLKIPQFAADNSHLYLWTTNSFLEEAFSLVRAWGFNFKTVLTWTKIQSNGKPSMKMGYYYRGATEHCLFAVRGKLRLLGKASSTAILLPRTPHSVKPDGFYAIVEEQSPGPRLDVFARAKRPGWDTYGNEVENDVNLR